MHTMKFSYGKRAIFLKVKEVKRLRGGVAVYAAQATAQIDAEIVKKGRFRMETTLLTDFQPPSHSWFFARSSSPLPNGVP